MKRVLVTGGTGFVGASLARRLLADGCEVHLAVRPNYSPWRIEAIRDSLHFHEAALHDAQAVRTMVERARPDWVFHLAVHGAYSWQRDMAEMTRTNFDGIVNLVDACASSGVEALVNAGSSSEYGAKDHAPQESEALEPNSCYAITKAAATHYCRFAAQERDMHLPTLRLYSVFGPYEDPNRLIPALIKAGAAGSLPPLANPAIARDFVYVDDVVEAFILAAKTKTSERGPIYNVGTGVESKLRDVVETARRVMDIRCEPEWGSMPDRAWDTTVWRSDNRKIRERLGWAPAFDFEAGLRRMLEWHRKHDLINTS